VLTTTRRSLPAPRREAPAPATSQAT